MVHRVFDAEESKKLYAGLNKEELESIKQQVQKRVAFQNVICQKASSTISTHCGPGTFGLLFMMR